MNLRSPSRHLYQTEVLRDWHLESFEIVLETNVPHDKALHRNPVWNAPEMRLLHQRWDLNLLNDFVIYLVHFSLLLLAFALALLGFGCV
jgi:hypothetical protein